MWYSNKYMSKELSIKDFKELSKHLDKSKYYFVSPSKFTSFKHVLNQSLTLKPKGLWFACGNAWLKFVVEEQLWETSYNYLYEVNVEDSTILYIRTLKQYDDFVSKYSYIHKEKTYTPAIGSIPRQLIDHSYVLINWAQVQTDGYDGLIICPSLIKKVWKKNKGDIDKFLWYITWDVASGVIWNKKGLKDVKLLFSKDKKGKWQKVLTKQ